MCVEAVLVAGSPVFVSVTEASHLTGAGFVCIAGRYTNDQPRRPAATRAILGLASAMALEDAVLHAEFKVGPRGWVLLEIALRPGGAMDPEMTRRATGADLYRAQALLALGQSESIDTVLHFPPSAPYAQVSYLVAEGQVRRFVPPKMVMAHLSDVHSVHQQAWPGQRVRIPLSDSGRAGYATGWGPDKERLDTQLSEALTLLCHEMGLTIRHPAPGQVAVA